MTDTTPSSSLRDSLNSQFGPHIGEAMFEIELAARKKTADKFRALQTQLAEINAQIDVKQQTHIQNLVPLQQRMDATHTAWVEACAAFESARVAGESSVMQLRGQAWDLIKEINSPHPYFENKVKHIQWGRPDWYKEEPDLPPMPEVNGPR